MSKLALLIIAYSLSLAVISVPEEMVCIKKLVVAGLLGFLINACTKYPEKKAKRVIQKMLMQLLIWNCKVREKIQILVEISMIINQYRLMTLTFRSSANIALDIF